MHAPYALNVLDTCLACAGKEEYLFCNLSTHAGERLNEIKSTAVYSKGAMLFIEGQQPRGVFVLCVGKAKLSTSSHKGKTIITKIAGPGDVLGLSAVVSNRPSEVTVEMMETGTVNFIPRDSLMRFLKHDSEVILHVAEELSRNYYSAHEEIRTLGLTASLSERLAKLLISWSTMQGDGSTQVKIRLTQEEIAESIGTTRQVLSRLLFEFKQKQLIEGNGKTFLIWNAALEKLIQS